MRRSDPKTREFGDEPEGPSCYRPAVRDHKSIIAWQEANKVVDAVLDASRTGWKPFAVALFAQLQRASLSVQLNIVEGYALRNSRSFRNHLRIAYGSAVETGELLELVVRHGLWPDEFATERSKVACAASACCLA